MAATPKPAVQEEVTYMRPVSNCAGCGDTKVSWSVLEVAQEGQADGVGR